MFKQTSSGARESQIVDLLVLAEKLIIIVAGTCLGFCAGNASSSPSRPIRPANLSTILGHITLQLPILIWPHFEPRPIYSCSASADYALAELGRLLMTSDKVHVENVLAMICKDLFAKPAKVDGLFNDF